MKNEQILKKAIEKAIKNGFNASHFSQEGYDLNKGIYGKKTYKDIQLSIAGVYLLFFSHDFAKALDYKLRDLGDWCDKGNEPLDFIKKLC